MKRYFYTLMFVVALTTNIFSQAWTQEASIPTSRVSPIYCAVNGKGYVGMGWLSNSTYGSDFWEYDTLTNTWTRKADFPADGRHSATAYAVKGKIYSFFGFDNSQNCRNDVWEYDPLTDNWTQKNLFPGIARYNGRGFVINDSLIYIGTGTYNNGNDYLHDFWMYNPSTDTWMQMQDFPGGPRMAAVSFEINGIGYYGTGLADSYTPTNDFWKYNPASDTWTQIPSFPGSPRAGLTGFVINNEGYVGSGFDNSYFYNTFYKFNPSNNTWSQIQSVPYFNNESGVGFTLGNKGYTGMGWDIYNEFSDFWQYDPNGFPQGVITLNKADIQLYPDPASNVVTIALQKSLFTDGTVASIYSVQGQLIKQYSLAQEKTELDISGLTSGLYIVKVFNKSQQFVSRLIKE
jgi:N-acetylneuraminic acid mutarotase